MGENSKEPPSNDSGKDHNMLEEDDESMSDESEPIDEKAYRELEVNADNLYLVILYSTLSSGASSKLQNVSQEDERIIAEPRESLMLDIWSIYPLQTN
jgi:hypothetical protein